MRWGNVVLAYPHEEKPDPSAPIEVVLVTDKRPADGPWQQTFLVTILEGGTLEQASNIIFGDGTHTAELFALVKLRNPKAVSPATVQAGDQFQITVDASRTYVLKKQILNQDGAISSREFFNGMTEKNVDRSGSATTRVLSFPRDVPVKAFEMSYAGRNVLVEPGGSVALLRYEQGDSYDETIKAAYGHVTAKAIRDFESQTSWTISRWPPANLEESFVAIPPSASFDDEPLTPLDFAALNKSGDPVYGALLAERAKAGLHPVRQRLDGIMYRAVITSSSITARRIAEILFNSSEEYVSVAEAAGVRLSTSDPAKLPKDYDVPLAGSDFLLYVDYAAERFETGASASQTGTVRLLNGTVIREYPLADLSKGDLLRSADYPTGYSRLVFEANNIAVQFLDFVFYTANFGKVDDDEARRRFIASTIWSWQRDFGACRSVEEITLRDSLGKQWIDVLLGPAPDESGWQALACGWMEMNPLLSLGLSVFAGTGLLVLLGVGLNALRRKVRAGEPL